MLEHLQIKSHIDENIIKDSCFLGGLNKYFKLKLLCIGNLKLTHTLNDLLHGLDNLTNLNLKYIISYF